MNETRIPITLLTGIVPYCWCCPILAECTEEDNPLLDAWGERRRFVELWRANCAQEHGWK